MPYAEVIGDPIAHSKSPLIHEYWLDRAWHRGRLPAKPRRKRRARPLASLNAVPIPTGAAAMSPSRTSRPFFPVSTDSSRMREAIGAVNCHRSRGRRAHRLQHRRRRGRGGARIRRHPGRKAVAHDRRGRRGARRSGLSWRAAAFAGLTIVVRNPAKAGGSAAARSRSVDIEITFRLCRRGLSTRRQRRSSTPARSAWSDADPMPQIVARRAHCHAPGATFFDMVYLLAETEFLSRRRGEAARQSRRWARPCSSARPPAPSACSSERRRPRPTQRCATSWPSQAPNSSLIGIQFGSEPLTLADQSRLLGSR